MRKLASIQTVNAIEPIPGADAIERVRALGRWVVAKKGEFAVGGRIVTCEIDSLVPERPEYEFVRKGSCKAARAVRAGGEAGRGSASRRSASAARCRRASASRSRSCRRAPRRTRAVPHLDPITLNHGVDELSRMSEGVSVLNPKLQREGIVLRPNTEEFEPKRGGRLSLKAITPQFLLKYNE